MATADRTITVTVNMARLTATERALLAVSAERKAQDARWGEQDHPDLSPLEWGSSEPVADRAAHEAHVVMCAQDRAGFWQYENARRARLGGISWDGILLEEAYEALGAIGDGPEALRAELIQVAAVAVAWAEAIERRAAR